MASPEVDEVKDDPHVCNQCGGPALWETCFACYDMIESGDYDDTP